jgi:hypothetical protein
MKNLEEKISNGEIKLTCTTEAFGFGLWTVPMAVATRTKLIALSLKESKDDFDKEVDLIYNNLCGIASWFGISIEKGTWDQKDLLLKNGWTPVEEFKKGTLPHCLWAKWAEAIHLNFLKKKIDWENVLLYLAELSKGKPILAINLQKWFSNSTEVEAKKQSLEATAYKAIAELVETIKLFTSHFSKTNDLENVEAMKQNLHGIYIPGETELSHLFGVRGIPHKEFIPFAFAANASITIASTWGWLAQIINPAMNLKIFCNEALPDANYAADIEKAMARFGYRHQYVLFNENTDSVFISEEVSAFLRENNMN